MISASNPDNGLKRAQISSIWCQYSQCTVAGEQMQTGPIGWDVSGADVYFDLTTKLTALYLTASAVMLLFLAIRFLPTLRRFRASAAALRTEKFISADATGPDVNAHPAQRPFEVAYTRMQVALTATRNWAQLTMLILLAYSASEITDLLRGISLSKMIGTSALSGSLARIFSMWTAALWFMVVLWLANWILSDRLARSADIQSTSSH
jgi:hypothetical protein